MTPIEQSQVNGKLALTRIVWILVGLLVGWLIWAKHPDMDHKWKDSDSKGFRAFSVAAETYLSPPDRQVGAGYYRFAGYTAEGTQAQFAEWKMIREALLKQFVDDARVRSDVLYDWIEKQARLAGGAGSADHGLDTATKRQEMVWAIATHDVSKEIDIENERMLFFREYSRKMSASKNDALPN